VAAPVRSRRPFSAADQWSAEPGAGKLAARPVGRTDSTERDTVISRIIDGQELRKGRKSGAGNDCAYLTSAASTAPLMVETKGEHVVGRLRLSRSARARLVAAVSAGAFGILGILGGADVPVGGGSTDAVAGCIDCR
jgi:hypothetical protein